MSPRAGAATFLEMIEATSHFPAPPPGPPSGSTSRVPKQYASDNTLASDFTPADEDNHVKQELL